MKLEHLLLGALLIRPRTGWDLKRYMDEDGIFLRPKTQSSQLYRTLQSLDDQGLVSFEVSGRPGGAQDAKIYSVTSAGEQHFFSWLRGPFVPTIAMPNLDLGARLAFAGFLEASEVVALLDVEIAHRHRQVATYRYRDRHQEIDPASPIDRELASLVAEETHRNGAASIDRHIENMERLREAVAARIRTRLRAVAP